MTYEKYYEATRGIGAQSVTVKPTGKLETSCTPHTAGEAEGT